MLSNPQKRWIPRNEPDRRHGKSVSLIRSIYIKGRRTNVSLENGFWDALAEIAADQDTNISRLISTIASRPKRKNLSSTIRLFILDYYSHRRDGEAKPPSYQGQGQSSPPP
jgi:predicted DNA-binding ribbon-helix-helix protein